MKSKIWRSAVALLSVLFIACRSDSVKKIDYSETVRYANSLSDGLEEGPWRIYKDSIGGMYSEGVFDRGAKVDLWKYRTASGVDSSVRYKRNAVRVDSFRFGMPITWEEVSSDDFDFVAYIQSIESVRVIVNEVEAPSPGRSVEEFARAMTAPLVEGPSYNDVECQLKLLEFSDESPVVLGQLFYTDAALNARMSLRALYKKVGETEFIDSSVIGKLEDESTVIAVFNDFLPNIIYGRTKLKASFLTVKSSRSVDCG